MDMNNWEIPGEVRDWAHLAQLCHRSRILLGQHLDAVYVPNWEEDGSVALAEQILIRSDEMEHGAEHLDYPLHWVLNEVLLDVLRDREIGMRDARAEAARAARARMMEDRA